MLENEKKSLEPDLNQWPKDYCHAFARAYSPPLYQLSYRGAHKHTYRVSVIEWRDKTVKNLKKTNCGVTNFRPVPIFVLLTLSVLESAAAQKKAKHKQACAERRADFTPFICSTDGAIHREGQHFLRRLSARLASKWEMSYSRAMGFVFIVNMRLWLAIVRASVHCL